jgi:hypothetical protein
MLFSCKKCGTPVFNLRFCEKCGTVLLDPTRGCRRMLKLWAKKLDSKPRDCRP